MKRLLCYTLFLVSSHFAFATIPQSEKQALIDLYTSTNGLQWNHSWNLDEDVATWKGVEIKNNHVVGLSLMNYNLRGAIPESIGDLKKLRVLNFAFNQITGEIPQNISLLSELIVLRLGKNKLSGTIPDGIGALKSLVIFDLFSNKISGTIPKTIANAKKLKVISFSDNNLAGSIPEEIGELKDLERLELADNNIYGEIPSSINKLSNLKMLVLADNRFSGIFPATVFALPKLQVLQLQENSFDQSHLQNAIPKQTNIALIDFDVLDENGENIRMNFQHKNKRSNTRLADTIFED